MRKLFKNSVKISSNKKTNVSTNASEDGVQRIEFFKRLNLVLLKT